MKPIIFFLTFLLTTGLTLQPFDLAADSDSDKNKKRDERKSDQEKESKHSEHHNDDNQRHFEQKDHKDRNAENKIQRRDEPSPSIRNQSHDFFHKEKGNPQSPQSKPNFDRGPPSQGVSPNFKEKILQRQDTGRRMRDRIGRDSRRKVWFKEPFWKRHHHQPSYWHRQQNWYGQPSWNTVNNWLAWGYGSPVYYDGGYPVPISTPLDEGAWPGPYGNAPFEPPAPQPPPWFPLGVFALANDRIEALEPTLFFQLALGREGTIGGTFFNPTTDELYPILGVVDKGTQKASWKIIGGKNQPTFTTGLYNLTLQESPVQVVFDKDMVESWLLIRVKE